MSKEKNIRKGAFLQKFSKTYLKASEKYLINADRLSTDTAKST